jgi:hypothetical protein
MGGTVMHIKNTARAGQGVAAGRGTSEKEGVRRADQGAAAARTVGVARARSTRADRDTRLCSCVRAKRAERPPRICLQNAKRPPPLSGHAHTRTQAASARSNNQPTKRRRPPRDRTFEPRQPRPNLRPGPCHHNTSHAALMHPLHKRVCACEMSFTAD